MRTGRKGFRRVVAWVCSLALCASMMPTAAFAAGPETTPTPETTPAVETEPTPDPSESPESTDAAVTTLAPGTDADSTAAPSEEPTVSPDGSPAPSEEPVESPEPSEGPADGTPAPSEEPAEQPQSDAIVPENGANSDVETYWGGGGHRPSEKKEYIWNVADITPHWYNNGYDVEWVGPNDEVNNTSNVKVYVSDRRDGDYQEIAPDDSYGQYEGYDEQYIKIVPEDGYYIEYVVVACNNGYGYGCGVLDRGEGFGKPSAPGESAIILNTDDDGFYDHEGTFNPGEYPYHVFVELEKCPEPAYLVYDAGEIGSGWNAEQVTSEMLGGQTIVSSDNSAKVSGTDVAFAFPKQPASHTVLEPQVEGITVDDQYYAFAGWELQYYMDDDIHDADDAFHKMDEPLRNPMDIESEENVQMYTHARLTAKWEKSDQPEPETKPGTPINIQVYLDGEPLTITEDHKADYVVIDTQDTTAEPEVSVSGGKYVYDYKYEQYNCADLKFTVTDGYILQAVNAELAYGSNGSDGVTGDAAGYVVDNVKGGSTVTIYLATPYTVEYYVDGDPTDEVTDMGTYAVDLPANVRDNHDQKPDNPEDKEDAESSLDNNGYQPGYTENITKVFGGWQSTVTPKTTEGVTVDGKAVDGWYKTADYEDTVTTAKLSAILAVGSGYTVDVADHVIQFFGTTKAPGLTVTKDVEAKRGETVIDPEKDPLQVGDVLTYTITVKNTGNTDFTGLTVTDTFTGAGEPTGMNPTGEGWTPNGTNKTYTWTIDSLKEGSNAWKATYTYTVTETDLGNEITNSVTVEGTELPKEPGDDTTVTVEDEKPSATIVKTSTVTRNGKPVTGDLKVGDQIEYKITVTNNGNVVLNDLTVTDTFDGTGEPTFPDNQKPNTETGNYQWTIDSLNKGATWEVTYTYTVVEGDLGKTIKNEASVEGGGITPPAPGKDEHEVEDAAPGLDVVKTVTRDGKNLDTDTPVNVGDELTYTITVTNTGNTTLTGLTVTDTFNGAGTKPVVLDEDNEKVGKWDGDVWTYTISSLAPGASVTYTYTYTVVEGDATEGNSLTNTATVNGGEPGDPSDTGETTNPVEDPGVSIKKTVDKTDEVEVGDTLTYTITVTNTGNTTLNDLTVTDTFTGTGGFGFSGDGEGSIKMNENDDGFVWTLPTIAPGESAVLTYTYTVQPEDAGMTISNEAVVNGPDLDDDPTDKTDTEVKGTATIDKFIGNIERASGDKVGTITDATPVYAGDKITYVIEITNTSATALKDITVSDTINGTQAGLPGNVTVDGKPTPTTWNENNGAFTATWTVASIDVGETVTINYTYTVQQADADVDRDVALKNTAASSDVTTDPGSDPDTENPVEAPAIDVEKSGEVGIDEELGGLAIHYTINVKNTGYSNMTKVELTDPMFAGLTADEITATTDSDVTAKVEKTDENSQIVNVTFGDNAVLAPGNNLTITYTHGVTSEEITAGRNDATGVVKVNNTVKVEGLTEYGSAPKDEATAETVVYSGTVTMQPADITIYMGGKGGYTGVVDDKGNIVQSGSGSESLPEPGFYFTLPDEINQELSAALDEEPDAAVDLSKYITVTAMANDDKPRTWTLKQYGATTSTALIGEGEAQRAHFVYEIEPAEGQDPIRVQFTHDGKTIVSDEFDVTDALYEEYGMSLYLGGVDRNTIAFVITIPEAADGSTPAKTYYCGFEESEPATLTVRYASDAHTTTKAVTNGNEIDTDNFGLLVEDGQKFNINQKDAGADGVDVTHEEVSLLADPIVSSGEDGNEYADALAEKAQTAAGFASSTVDAMYLDLVDANNGNAWLTTKDNGEVTVFWPYPEGVTKDSNIKLYHFDGLDRDMATNAVMDEIDKTPASEVDITKYDKGFTFTTSSFSPFVLVQDTTRPSGGGDGNNDNNNNNSNTNEQTTTVNVTNEALAPAAAPAAVAVPQTSDDMPIGALTAAAAAAAAAFVALVVVRKRRHGKD